jgi:hypothetical protein
MSRATVFQNLGCNAVSIIPNSKTELPFSVTYLSFDIPGVGVLEGIA